MSALEVKVTHELGVDEAAKRVRGLISHLRVKYGGQLGDVDEWWSGHNGGFSFRLMGSQIKGDTDVSAHDVRVRAELPFAASMFKGTIEKGVREELIACLKGER